jgi:type II secretory pathway component PulJ
VHGDSNRRGAALVEVLVSLVLLATAGTALISFLGQTSRTLRHLRDQERISLRASAQLEALVTWDRSTFLNRIGRTRIGDWTLFVGQTTTDLFDVAIAESDTSAVLLRTTVYRPDTIDAARR